MLLERPAPVTRWFSHFSGRSETHGSGSHQSKATKAQTASVQAFRGDFPTKCMEDNFAFGKEATVHFDLAKGSWALQSFLALRLAKDMNHNGLTYDNSFDLEEMSAS